MTTPAAAHPTLASSLLGKRSVLQYVLLALAGSALLWASAKVQVPFYPVPMTMQTFVVLVIGMAYGWRLGAATVLLYLAEGAIGMPVFAGTPERGIGLAYMVGPTGGYLVGFVVAAFAVGLLAERGWDRSIVKTLVAMTLGTAIIFVFGAVWLGALIGWDKPVLELGVIPFLPGAAFKIALAAAVLPLAWRGVSRR
ncbi:biotin transporter BioY [Hoeflea sp. WL0058]|uniref:Biotin transporter n=1 Tax=Flavimaribacter sediminis TaxID=2865987 RepID=A0AAE2ZKP8_9HYPH|nr:biotin transporter BioY [Flavimaribacter sediminis]MBW8636375.1 biotin transporter BioY [Flavimaribacter sediminis]